ncbi:protein serine/threonine phosphatase 2C [Tricholoma matsutake]|nr:protein serine/threonine phosphatase 2C [Tricholoma matsutake 945]
MYVANVGKTLAVVSRHGVARAVSRPHDPFDRAETARIRAAEGWVSPAGLVNEEADNSRAFGYYHLLPVINARPDVVTYELNPQDEFVIVANRGLWDYVSYQTAVDIARTARADLMIAAQKLRDFSISYGADGSTMIMVIGLAEALEVGVFKRKPQIWDGEVDRLKGEVPPPVGHIALAFSALVKNMCIAARAQGRHPDPLPMWAGTQHASRPTPLAKLAKRLFSVCVNSTSCERLFSMFGVTLLHL